MQPEAAAMASHEAEPRAFEVWGCPKCNILFLTAKYYLESLVPEGPDVARKFQT